jgi:Na+-translocating ferredoxin:NAD+ oxidoreductase RnfD subunit
VLFSFITKGNILELIFLNSYLFIFTFVASDSISSSYTLKGVKIYGLVVGILTFILSFFTSILAPFISIIVASFFSTLIDNLTHKFGKKN